MDASMDPKDTTGWREAAQAAGSAKDAAVVGNKKPTKHEQLQEISEYRRMIQKSLSTTKSQDSDRAKQMRSELKQLLARRAALKAAVSREEDRVIKKGGRAWVGHVKPDPAQSEDIINRLARREDARATYRGWLSGGGRRGQAERGRVQALDEYEDRGEDGEDGEDGEEDGTGGGGEDGGQEEDAADNGDSERENEKLRGRGKEGTKAAANKRGVRGRGGDGDLVRGALRRYGGGMSQVRLQACCIACTNSLGVVARSTVHAAGTLHTAARPSCPPP